MQCLLPSAFPGTSFTLPQSQSSGTPTALQDSQKSWQSPAGILDAHQVDAVLLLLCFWGPGAQWGPFSGIGRTRGTAQLALMCDSQGVVWEWTWLGSAGIGLGSPQPHLLSRHLLWHVLCQAWWVCVCVHMCAPRIPLNRISFSYWVWGCKLGSNKAC